MTFILFTNLYNAEDEVSRLFELVETFTLQPKKWVIINDGSNDNTEQVIKEHIQQSGRTNVVIFNLPPKEKGNLKTIGHAYNQAFEQLQLKQENYEFMSIIDPDNRIHPQYYEKVKDIFDSDPTIGVISGYNPDAPKLKMPQGNGKCVRWSIIQNMTGEFWDPAPDTFLNIKAWAQGYKWMILENEYGVVTGPIAARNLTPAGARHAGWMWYYASGSWSGALARVIYRALKRRQALAYFKGFLDNALHDKMRCTDPDVIRFYKNGAKQRSDIIITDESI